ncbi:hypothetical protein DBR45_22220, partial [Pseudomonas sp. HMWF031]
QRRGQPVARQVMSRQTRQRSRTVQTQGHGSHSEAPFYNCGATLDLSRTLVEEVFSRLIYTHKKGDREVTFLCKSL